MNVTAKKTVCFIRHGQSTHNAMPVFQGPDSPLSEQGILEAEEVAKRLASAPLEALITSPYPRAQQTAKIIANKTGHKVVVSDLFVERGKPSAIDGKPYADKEASTLYREYIQRMYDSGKQVGDAESYDDIVARADRALAYLLERPEAYVAVITHAWFLRIIIARVILGEQLNGALLQRFEELITISNASITTLTYANAFEEDFRWRISTLNDRTHVDA